MSRERRKIPVHATILAVVLLVWVPAIAQEKSDDSFYAMDFLRSLFSKSQTDAVRNAKDPLQLELIYDQLYRLRSARVVFTDALQQYLKSVEENRSSIEQDFRLNDVGIASATLLSAIQSTSKSFENVGARLSLNDPKLDKALRAYFGANRSLIAGDILRDHKLNSGNLSLLREVSTRAQDNGQLLDSSIDGLRLLILSQHPEYKNHLPSP